MGPRDIIILKCNELFLRYGVKNLTMDDIARELGMSKKTIYQYVQNKSDLVKKVMQSHLDKEMVFIDEVGKNAKNAIEEHMRMLTYMSKELQTFNSSIFFELQKYYPESYDLFNEYREKVSLPHILKNMERGISEGLYRADMNPEIVARIYVYALDILIDQQRFPAKKYHFYNLYKEFVNYHLSGILTDKGAKYLEQSKLLKLLEQ
jgi:AcrR family transcriptional regulator